MSSKSKDEPLLLCNSSASNCNRTCISAFFKHLFHVRSNSAGVADISNVGAIRLRGYIRGLLTPSRIDNPQQSFCSATLQFDEEAFAPVQADFEIGSCGGLKVNASFTLPSWVPNGGLSVWWFVYDCCKEFLMLMTPTGNVRAKTNHYACGTKLARAGTTRTHNDKLNQELFTAKPLLQ
jgi:hypothetical protein